ncbi:Potassium voltage-gated channel subfamily KQT; possible potassium channel, VIC family [Thioalkalivibrio nitratireducens DSM 14787]|uniref:Potassium voltage-gated channel subfamily KQT possible potassium channel, VIC family n=1 Tax=Thioalkalivibrio nitratireducens (strain DSM 14787 / UNIQEM 213 / ALEN2) TaxID=1255043 RepID=L0E202_THIND|nr:ion transporter [Thioalkalivibrio nitratireducens]AGA34671.1 Potassium voltage-gated channel subfamily KQT; possible potassium channel, VIC family [Thioalkalivibrio nitratireducens DSM 14787]
MDPADEEVGARYSLRQRLYLHLEPTAWPRTGLSPANLVIAVLIVFAALLAILETEETLRADAPRFFQYAEFLILLLFSTEYMARLYAAGEDPRYRGVLGRLRYMRTWWAIVDLLAILPSLVTMGGQNTFLLRLLKLLRLLRLSRLGRFSRAWSAIAQAVQLRSFELLLSFGAAGMLLILSSACLYLVEGGEQPEAFGSIPRALWWSVATLTTVGYGDVTPVTALGRILAGITALAGIGLIALPTGVLASAFSDALRRQAAHDRSGQREE